MLCLESPSIIAVALTQVQSTFQKIVNVMSTCSHTLSIRQGRRFSSLRYLLLGLAVVLLPLSAQAKVDMVLVKKSQRRLYLMDNGKVIQSFRISLGDHPQGQKYFEGDGRTPEGQYVLDWRNPNSEYYKSIHISYPTTRQRRKAQQLGFSAGGDIMIHGLPNDAGKWAFAFKGLDWTGGCIAVSDKAMDMIWREVSLGTPIRIEP